MKHDFRYISVKDPSVKKEHHDLLCILSELQKALKGVMVFKYKIVGSYSRNMITYDANSNIGYDFDINLEIFDIETRNAKQIKHIFLNAIGKIVKKYGYSNPKDSTSVITIKKIDTKKSRILSSCDFCIVYNYEDEEGYDCQDYIKFVKNKGTYIWNERSYGYYMLPDKIDWLKDPEINLWNDVRVRYLELKNENTDENLHSRTLFAQAVHQICQKNGYYEED